jgi:hypothetical protein
MPLNRTILFLAVVGGSLLCMAAPAALAQQQPSQTTPNQQPQSVSDREIETFAAAATEVRRLNKQWAPRLEAAANESKEAEETVRRQALTEMAKAVEDKGMSVDRYEQIFTVAQSNGDVRRKIVERMPKDE